MFLQCLLIFTCTPDAFLTNVFCLCCMTSESLGLSSKLSKDMWIKLEKISDNENREQKQSLPLAFIAPSSPLILARLV